MSQPTHAYAVLQRYHYDAADRLISAQAPGSSAHRRFYAGTVPGNELVGDLRRSHLNSGGQLSGIREQQNGPATVQLFVMEQQGSVLRVLSAAGLKSLAYTPHGEGGDLSLPGFNGEQPDAITGNYLLGNGYRAYNPTLQRFHSPDSFSPFAGGGLNAYTYCLGDPVNRADPTGHMSWQAGVGMGLGVVGLLYGGHALVFGALAMTSGVSAASVAVVASVAAGLGAAGAGIAQAVISQSDPNSATAATLGWIALGLGAASFVSGIAANALSPANETRPVQVSRTIGRTGTGEAAPLSFDSLAPIGPVVRRINEYLSSGEVIALQDTSRLWRAAGAANMRPLATVLGNAATTMDLVGNRSSIEAAFRVAIGGEPGMMPAQLSRAGINPRTIPTMSDDTSYLPDLFVQLDSSPMRSYARHAARVRQSTLRIQYRYSSGPSGR